MIKTDIPTYLITDDGESAGKYYNEISSITDIIVSKGETELGSLLDNFSAYSLYTIHNPQKSRNEILLEILTQGVLWRYYAAYSLQLNFATEKILNFLNFLRTRNKGYIKCQTDRFKGYFISHFFPYSLNGTNIQPTVNAANFSKLLKWMRASGEYYYEADQLKHWYTFWKQQSGSMEEEFQKVQDFTGWFISCCQDELVKYTGNTSAFRENLNKKSRREDLMQIGKRQGEYFLNMFGAEILNRAYRPEFLNSRKRVVFVPGCMRAEQGHNCKAVADNSGIVCASCNKQCNVYKVNEEGKKKGYIVRILLHESNMFAHSSGSVLPQNTAVVGVACVPCLLAGGWKVRSTGIPVQCVLLNYSGCKKHWHNTGITTNLDTEQLDRVIAL